MIRIKVGTIDVNGYCGRDRHPEPTDAGRVGVLVKMEQFVEPPVNEGEGDVGINENVYSVLLDDGRTIDLMEHEVDAAEFIIDEVDAAEFTDEL